MFKYALIALCLAACILADETTTDGTCTPGTHKKVDCNDCRCNADGSGWGCTKMACPPPEEVETSTSAPACEEGTTWKVDCNTCTCHNGVAACTLMGCVEQPSS